ncbi:MAG TPA: hypothetical protein VF389_11710 [Woeseiaceae bacterium]
MAAETLTSAQAAAGKPVAGHGLAGNLKCVYGTYDLAANVEDGDIFEMCRVPKGATVVFGVLYGEDIDTGTEALDMDVGWAANGDEIADPDGFGNLGVLTGDASVHGEAGITVILGGVLREFGPKTFNAETLLQIEANAAANAGGTGRLTLVVHYLMP